VRISYISKLYRIYHTGGILRDAPKEGYRATASAPNSPKNRNLKNTGFVDIMISKAVRDLPSKSADDWYTGILKNKLIKLKKEQEDRTL
jgi:hypothetical protein